MNHSDSLPIFVSDPPPYEVASDSHGQIGEGGHDRVPADDIRLNASRVDAGHRLPRDEACIEFPCAPNDEQARHKIIIDGEHHEIATPADSLTRKAPAHKQPTEFRKAENATFAK